MTLRRIHFPFLIALFIAIVNGCRKDPVVNYEPELTCAEDPCVCQNTTSAGFIVLEGQRNDGMGQGLLVEVPDTVMTGNTIFLEAEEENCTYSWLVDSITYTGKRIAIPKSLVPKSISARLIVEKDSGYFCPSTETGIDTSYGQIRVISWKNWPLTDSFRGYWFTTSDTFQISISADTNVIDPGNWEYLSFENLDKNACSASFCCSEAKLYYNYFEFNSNLVSCKSTEGVATISKYVGSQDSLFFTYEYIPNLNNVNNSVMMDFIGVRY